MLRMFKNAVLRKLFGPKRDVVSAEWRRLHREELYDLYYWPNVIWVIKLRRERWVGRVVHVRERIDEYRVLVARPDGRRPLGRLYCSRDSVCELIQVSG
jgi:hypothetical protein